MNSLALYAFSPGSWLEPEMTTTNEACAILASTDPRPAHLGARRLAGRALGLCLCAAIAGGACQRGTPAPALIQLGEAQKLAGDLRVAFAKAAGASDRAVMAETDEASVAFAEEAKKSAQAVEDDAKALAPLLNGLGYQVETRALEEFRKQFVEYRKLDGEVLQLAVENTNLKAQRLSFGPVREAADAFRDSLEAVVRGTPARDRCRAEALAAKATVAVREIQVLQAPHIAEAAAPRMDVLETEMTTRQTSAREALAKLGELGGTAARPEVSKAAASLSQFESLSSQLVALSRRNSNVRSLALALGPKPGLTAACDASLTALVQALAKQGSAATR